MTGVPAPRRGRQVPCDSVLPSEWEVRRRAAPIDEGRKPMTRASLWLILPWLLLGAGSAAAQPTGLELSITQPADGDVVGRELTVTGTSAEIATERILVFVYAPAADRWFFQGEATVDPSGAWQVYPVIVSDGALRSARITAEGVRIVATAMDDVPSGLSGIPAADFPPPGTLAQSPIVVVSRGE